MFRKFEKTYIDIQVFILRCETRCLFYVSFMGCLPNFSFGGSWMSSLGQTPRRSNLQIQQDLQGSLERTESCFPPKKTCSHLPKTTGGEVPHKNYMPFKDLLKTTVESWCDQTLNTLTLNGLFRWPYGIILCTLNPAKVQPQSFFRISFFRKQFGTEVMVEAGKKDIVVRFFRFL